MRRQFLNFAGDFLDCCAERLCTTAMSTATTLYTDVFHVLTSEHETPAIRDAREYLLRSVSGSEAQVDEEIDAGEAMENEIQRVTIQFTDVKTLLKKSPYTAVFARSIAEVSASDDADLYGEYSTRSPQCFQVIKEMMHLYPMWSSIFQENVERFAIDVPSVARSECEEIEPICLTNASVESYFRSVKHRRLSGRHRVRPYQFVAAELEYVNGKLNQMKLPKLTTKRRKDESEKEEHWGARKCHATYTDLPHAAKLLKNLTGSKNRLPHRLLQRELADTEIQRIHMFQRSLPQYGGLAEPAL